VITLNCRSAEIGLVQSDELCALRSDEMLKKIVVRSREIDNQKYTKAAISTVGIGAVVAFCWYNLRSSARGDDAGVAAAGDGFQNRKLGMFSQVREHFLMIMAISVATSISTFFTTNIFGAVKEQLQHIWNGKNYVRLFSVLKRAAMLSFDSTIKRKKYVFSVKDRETQQKYNSFLLSVERYVIELSAFILSKAKSYQIDLTYDVESLLSQLENDVESAHASTRLWDLEKKDPDAVSGKIIFENVLETVRRIEDLYVSFDKVTALQSVEDADE
jgi:hypothetical protein